MTIQVQKAMSSMKASHCGCAAGSCIGTPISLASVGVHCATVYRNVDFETGSGKEMNAPPPVRDASKVRTMRSSDRVSG